MVVRTNRSPHETAASRARSRTGCAVDRLAMDSARETTSARGIVPEPQQEKKNAATGLPRRRLYRFEERQLLPDRLLVHEYRFVAERGKRGAGERSQPEQPELRDDPLGHEHGRPRAAGRIHGGVRDGNADQMNQRERESDREARETGRRTRMRRAQNHDQEHERHDELADQGSGEGIPTRRMLAVAIRGKTSHAPELPPPPRAPVQHTRADDLA